MIASLAAAMPVSVETADVLAKLGIYDGYELVRTHDPPHPPRTCGPYTPRPGDTTDAEPARTTRRVARSSLRR